MPAAGRASGAARTYDHVDESGPRFNERHPRIRDEAERERVLDYLDAAPTLLIAPDMGEDVVDPSRGMVVESAMRTDGHWIWSDALTYYLREHEPAPDPGLLTYIEQREYKVLEIDNVDVHRALCAFDAVVPATMAVVEER